MIAGIGIDVISPKRFDRIKEKIGKDFFERVFVPGEIEYCESMKRSMQHYAARFAAKEALLKAFGTGLRGEISWQDVAVRKDELGAPYIELSGAAEVLAKGMGVRFIHLSMSHDEDAAAAVVVLEKDLDQ
ncbi:MAG: holo-ACP synthase [Candidatus Zixiibacteriota bacterium]